METHRTLHACCRFFLSLCLCLARPVAGLAQAPGELVDWKVEALDRGEAAIALSELYATMYNSGQIATREVEVQKGDTPADVMRRAGSWPAYLGSANRLLDAVLCDLNPTVCRREKSSATGVMLSDISQNVADTVPTDGDWTGLQPGSMLLIPDYNVEQGYETIATSVSYLAKRYGSQVPIESTGLLAALYCNQQQTPCQEQHALAWDGDNIPPILQFDPRQFDASSQGRSVPEDVIAAYLEPESRTTLVAVPYLKLRQNLALPRTGTPAQVGADEIQQRLDGKILVAPSLRTESTEALMAFNLDLLDRMKLSPAPPDDLDEPSNRIVTIYHFDKQANLQHCLFRNLTGIELMEWRVSADGTTAGPVSVEWPDPAAECALTEGVGVASRDHGTHTLGLLVGQLEAFARVLPPDVTYFTVVHVPLNASDFESGTAPEADSRIGPVLASMIPPHQPDVVSMSLSWPAAGLDTLNQSVLQKEELVTFVVAAPRQETLNECARGPAGIKWSDGNFAENVISVVGLAVAGPPEHETIETVADAGTGSTCHDIGAIGTLFGPVGTTNAVDQMIGASQATPLVAATVAELIRRFPSSRPRPGKIADHLIASAWFDTDMLNLAKGTMLDSGAALLTADTDLVITRSGCQVRGDYVQIRSSAGTPADYFFKVGIETRFVSSRRKLLSFRNLDAGRVLVVRLEGEKIIVESGEREDNMDKRTLQFSPSSLSQVNCDGISLGKDTIPVSVVDQLIISKIGG